MGINLRKITSNLTSSKTIKHSLVTTSSTVISGVLGLIFYILLARFLGAKDFGVFFVSITMLNLISDIGSIGTDTGVINFVSRYSNNDPIQASKYLKVSYTIKLFLSFVILFVGWLLIPTVAINILNKPELVTPLHISLLGSIIQLFYSLGSSALQSYEKFGIWSLINILLNVVRLSCVILLSITNNLNTNNAILLYSIVPIIGITLHLFILPPFWKEVVEGNIFRKMLHYNKWIGLSTIIAAISSRLDTIVTTRLLTLSSVGVYSVATNITQIIPQIVFAIASVAAPKWTKFNNNKDAKQYLIKLQIFVLVLGLFGAFLGLVFGPYIIPIIYGVSYSESVGPFLILLCAQVLFLMAIPYHTSIYYYFQEPKLFVLFNFINMLILILIGPVMIVKFSFNGAAATVLISQIANLIIPAIWVFSKFSKEK